MRDITKFLSLFTEQSAGARLLLKEQINLQLEKTAKKALTQQDIMRKIHGEAKFSPDEGLREKMMKMPHIASAFN